MSTDSPKRPFTRPTSEQLVDLHVYIVPKDSWNEKFNSAYNEVINQTISCGFVRVWPELTILNLREAIYEQLGDDSASSLPKDYVFLRSVGRCLAQVRSKQEATLKVKCFIPPRAYAPEIFILDAKYGSQSISATTTPQSLRSSFGSSRIDSGHLSSGDEIAGTNGSLDLNEGIKISEGSAPGSSQDKVDIKQKPHIDETRAEKRPRKKKTGKSGNKESGIVNDATSGKARALGMAGEKDGTQIDRIGDVSDRTESKGGRKVGRKLLGKIKPKGTVSEPQSILKGQVRDTDRSKIEEQERPRTRTIDKGAKVSSKDIRSSGEQSSARKIEKRGKNERNIKLATPGHGMNKPNSVRTRGQVGKSVSEPKSISTDSEKSLPSSVVKGQKDQDLTDSKPLSKKKIPMQSSVAKPLSHKTQAKQTDQVPESSQKSVRALLAARKTLQQSGRKDSLGVGRGVGLGTIPETATQTTGYGVGMRGSAGGLPSITKRQASNGSIISSFPYPCSTYPKVTQNMHPHVTHSIYPDKPSHNLPAVSLNANITPNTTNNSAISSMPKTQPQVIPHGSIQPNHTTDTNILPNSFTNDLKKNQDLIKSRMPLLREQTFIIDTQKNLPPGTNRDQSEHIRQDVDGKTFVVSREMDSTPGNSRESERSYRSETVSESPSISINFGSANSLKHSRNDSSYSETKPSKSAKYSKNDATSDLPHSQHNQDDLPSTSKTRLSQDATVGVQDEEDSEAGLGYDPFWTEVTDEDLANHECTSLCASNEDHIVEDLGEEFDNKVDENIDNEIENLDDDVENNFEDGENLDENIDTNVQNIDHIDEQIDNIDEGINIVAEINAQPNISLLTKKRLQSSRKLKEVASFLSDIDEESELSASLKSGFEPFKPDQEVPVQSGFEPNKEAPIHARVYESMADYMQARYPDNSPVNPNNNNNNFTNPSISLTDSDNETQTILSEQNHLLNPDQNLHVLNSLKTPPPPRSIQTNTTNNSSGDTNSSSSTKSNYIVEKIQTSSFEFSSTVSSDQTVNVDSEDMLKRSKELLSQSHDLLSKSELSSNPKQFQDSLTETPPEINSDGDDAVPYNCSPISLTSVPLSDSPTNTPLNNNLMISGHVMPAIRPAQSNQEPSVSRTASGAKSGGKRDIYSNATNEDSGISDEAMVDGNDGDYHEQRSESMHLERTEATLPDSTSARLQSREEPIRPHESSRQSSRHPSRQSRHEDDRHAETALSHLEPYDDHEPSRNQEESSRQSAYSSTLQSHLDPYAEQSERQNESSRQSSRHASRQSRHEVVSSQDPGYGPVVVPRLDFSSDAGPEDNGLGDSMDTVQDVDDIDNTGRNPDDAEMEAEMEEIRHRQAEELRLSRMRSRELSHSRGPPSGLGSPAREDIRSQMTNVEAENRISREPSRNDNLLGVGEEMDRCITQQTQAADVEEMEEDEEKDDGMQGAWGADVANDAMQDLQLGDEQDEQDKTEEDDKAVDNEVAKEYERLQNDLEEARAKRLKLEQNREDLVKRAKSSQAATQEKRHKSRSVWKKKYYEQKKRTLPLEEQVTKLKSLLDQQHRKMLSQLEGRGKKSVSGPPSKKNDHKIAILKTNHEMEDVKRKVENAQMRLASEIKLRNQAENELRNLRAEVMQRKIHVSLTRSTNQLPVISEPGTPTAGPKGGRVSNLGGRSRQGGTPGRQSTKKYKSGTPR